MANIREGNNSVLLVVDVQVAVVNGAWERSRIIENISTAVEKARSQGVPVIWVQHSDDELVYGSPEWQIVPELTPLDGEQKIYKHYNSAFEETDLDETLAQLDVAHIVLAGAATNWCIRATAYGILERGYDLTLVEDAHTTESIEFEDGTKIEAEDIIRELNIGLRWVSYPERTNRTVAASGIDFGSIGNNR